MPTNDDLKQKIKVLDEKIREAEKILRKNADREHAKEWMWVRDLAKETALVMRRIKEASNEKNRSRR